MENRSWSPFGSMTITFLPPLISCVIRCAKSLVFPILVVPKQPNCPALPVGIEQRIDICHQNLASVFLTSEGGHSALNMAPQTLTSTLYFSPDIPLTIPENPS